MNEDDNFNIEDDPNILELDISKLSASIIDTKEKNPFFFIPVKSILPKHIDDVLEKEFSEFMASVKEVLSLNKNIPYEVIIPIYGQNIKISLLREIKKNLNELRELDKRKQNLAVKSIIEDYLFNINFVIALAKGDRKKLNEIIKKIEGDYKGVNRELFIAHSKIKQRSKNKRQKAKAEMEFYEKAISGFKAEVIRQAETFRFKNGNLNFSKLGRKFGKDPKTMKNWCQKSNIPFHLLK